MYDNTKRVLNDIQTILINSSYDEALELWDILTALRGPDSEDSDLKECTTGVIRYKTFGEYAIHRIGAHVNEDSVFLARKRERYNSKNEDHFMWHVRKAFKALGLNINEIV